MSEMHNNLIMSHTVSAKSIVHMMTVADNCEIHQNEIRSKQFLPQNTKTEKCPEFSIDTNVDAGVQTLSPVQGMQLSAVSAQ